MLNRGFTLIELLVVLVIVGIVTGLAVIAVRGKSLDQVAEEELRRLQGLLDLASEQAVLEGREYGVAFSEQGYQFLRFQDLRWSPVLDDELFRERQLESGLVLTLSVEKRPVQLITTGSEPQRPQILLYSSGERTEFELTIRPRDQQAHARLYGSELGRLEIRILTQS